MSDKEWKQLTMQETMEHMYRTKEHCDAVIRCRDIIYKVHKAVICARCPYFRAAFNGHFAESASNDLEMEEEEPAVLSNCLEYIYLDTYSASSDPDAVLHAKLYAAGDRFMLPGLMDMALSHFRRVLPDVSQALNPNISDIVCEVYATAAANADGTRQDLVAYIETRLALLLKTEYFRELLHTVDGLAVDLLQAQLKSNANPMQTQQDPKANPESQSPKYCTSLSCNGFKGVHLIPACDQCGQHANLRNEEPRIVPQPQPRRPFLGY